MRCLFIGLGFIPALLALAPTMATGFWTEGCDDELDTALLGTCAGGGSSRSRLTPRGSLDTAGVDVLSGCADVGVEVRSGVPGRGDLTAVVTGGRVGVGRGVLVPGRTLPGRGMEGRGVPELVGVGAATGVGCVCVCGVGTL